MVKDILLRDYTKICNFSLTADLKTTKILIEIDKSANTNIPQLFNAQQHQGCADSGFCYTCKIIVGDTTCFCGGGICPLCGNHVAPRSIPKNLHGTYEKIVKNCSPITVRYENGEFKEIIEPKKS